MGPEARPWSAVTPPPESPLEGDLQVDVCVIGAGIAGVATAHELAKRGGRVVVLEAEAIGAGETGNTTAHLASAVDDRYVHIEAMHGAEGARLCAASHAGAIDRYESIVREEGIECGFKRVDGLLYLSDEDDPRLLDEEEAAARRAGLMVEQVPARHPGIGQSGVALRFADQARIEPLRFLSGLAAAAVRKGARLCMGARAAKIDREKEGVKVRVENGPIVSARHVVMATNVPFNTLVKMHTKQIAYRTYAIALEVEPGAIEDALVWDTGEKRGWYHYARLHTPTDGGPPLLIVGGEDHRTGQADDAEARWNRLEEWTRRHFECGAVRRRWSGQVIEPVDGVGYIGRCFRHDDRVLLATGDSGMGMTHGMIAGMLLSDIVTGADNPWEKLYDPSRVTLRATGDYLTENLNTLGQYLEWLRPPAKGENDLPAPGHGAVVCQGLKPLAVYREPSGQLHVRSAICTHLGGLVAWNSGAGSWDCPCHGSRFTPDGRVLNGPAATPLAPETLHTPTPPPPTPTPVESVAGVSGA